MTRHWYAVITLGLVSVAIPLRAANGPRAGRDAQIPVVWTNDDLEKLHGLGLISIVARTEKTARVRRGTPVRGSFAVGPSIVVVTTVDLFSDNGEVALRRVEWIGLPRKTDGWHLNFCFHLARGASACKSEVPGGILILQPFSG